MRQDGDGMMRQGSRRSSCCGLRNRCALIVTFRDQTVLVHLARVHLISSTVSHFRGWSLVAISETRRYLKP